MISSPGRSPKPRAHDEEAARLRQAVAHHLDQQRRVDVAAGEERARPRPRPAPCRRAAPRPRRRRRPRPASFVRSSRSTIAWLIWSSVTVTTSSSSSREDRRGERARLLDRDPLRDRVAVLGAAGEGADVLGLDADEPHVRAERRSAIAIPAASPPPPIGTTSVPSVGQLLGELEPDRALPRDHALVLERVDERRAGRLDVLLRRRHRLVEAGADELDLGAVVARRVDLGHRRVLRHEDRRPRSRPPAPPTRPPGRGCPRSRRRRPPRAPPSVSVAIVLTAPRILNAPVRCRFSAFSWTRRPASRESVSDGKTGVTRAIPAIAGARRLDVSERRGLVAVVDSVHLLEDLTHGRERVELARLDLVEQPPQLGLLRHRRLQVRLRPARRRGEHLAGQVLPPPLLEQALRLEEARGAPRSSPRARARSRRARASVRTIGGRHARSRSSARIERTSFSIVLAAG